MDKLATGLLYFGAILTTFAMLVAAPTALIWAGIGCFRSKPITKPTLIALSFPAAYIVGGLIGWAFRPFNWSMSFIDTLRAQTADHSIEYYAERVLLFVLMTGSMGVWMVGLGMAVWRKWLGRHSPQIS